MEFRSEIGPLAEGNVVESLGWPGVLQAGFEAAHGRWDDTKEVMVGYMATAPSGLVS